MGQPTISPQPIISTKFPHSESQYYHRNYIWKKRFSKPCFVSLGVLTTTQFCRKYSFSRHLEHILGNEKQDYFPDSSSRWSLETSNWSLEVNRCRGSLVVGRWRLVVGHWSLVVGH